MTHTRESLTAFIERHGGRVAGSVSGKTDLLIVGENFGETKVRAAHEKGVPTLWWGFAEWLGLFSTRSGGELGTAVAKIVTAVIDIMSTIVEDLYVRNSTEPSAFIPAARATSYLQILAWGQAEDSRRALTKPPKAYLEVRNGRNDVQLLEDMRLVMEILVDLHEASGDEGTRYVAQEWTAARQLSRL